MDRNVGANRRTRTSQPGLAQKADISYSKPFLRPSSMNETPSLAALYAVTTSALTELNAATAFCLISVATC